MLHEISVFSLVLKDVLLTSLALHDISVSDATYTRDYTTQGLHPQTDRQTHPS